MDTCPQHISKTAYYSIIFITQCIYVSIYYNYYLLTMLLSGLTVTSVCFWSDCSDMSVRYIDITFAVTTLSVKSYIALTDFTPFTVPFGLLHYLFQLAQTTSITNLLNTRISY